MPEWITGLVIGSVGLPALIYLTGKYLPNSRFRKWGIPHGRALSKVGRMKMGKVQWEKIESQVLEKTFIGGIIAYVDGIRIGLNEDDDK